MKVLLSKIWQWLDRRRPRTLAGWIITLLLGTVTYFSVGNSIRFCQIWRLQLSIERRIEIYFKYDRPDGPTREAIDEGVFRSVEYFYNIFPRLRDKYLRPASYYCERLKSIGHGKITGIHILDPLNITPDFGRSLRAFTDIQTFELEVWFEGTPESAESLLQTVGKMKRLRVLTIECGSVSDEHLKQIGALKDLENLDLESCEITDASLPILLNFKKLKRLDICGSLTADGARQLISNYPLAEIFYQDCDNRFSIEPSTGFRDTLQCLEGVVTRQLGQQPKLKD